MELNYKVFGKGDPVIILHGLFGMLDNWQGIARQLAKNYKTYILDQRNHGRSPHAEPFDYPTMADDLRIFMIRQGIYNAHIIGHSMGGKTAMELAMRFPDMIDRLIVVDIAPKEYEEGHEFLFDAMNSLNFSLIKSRQDAEDQLSNFIDDDRIRLFFLKNLHRTREGTFGWKLNLPVIYEYYEKLLQAPHEGEAFEGPALFIKGEKSNYILPKDMPRIKELFPAARLLSIERAGHWVHTDGTEEFIQAIEDFLER